MDVQLVYRDIAVRGDTGAAFRFRAGFGRVVASTRQNAPWAAQIRIGGRVGLLNPIFP